MVTENMAKLRRRGRDVSKRLLRNDAQQVNKAINF